MGRLPALTATAWAVATVASADTRFIRKQIGVDKVYETTVVADFTGDGKPDILSGTTLYEGPDWKKHDLGIAWNGTQDWEHALDVDLDGKMDVLKGSTANGSLWYRNILPQAGAWPKQEIDAANGAHESVMADLDGDGKAREHVPVDLKALSWYSLDNADGKVAWRKFTAVGSNSLKTIGAGDVNGDGKIDLLRSDGWFENPGDPKKPYWKEHCLALGVNKALSKRFITEGKCGAIDHTSVISVYDVDADGLNDLVLSAAHNDGIYWYKQSKSPAGDISFDEYIIDADIIRTHSVLLADLDNDGDKDFLASSHPVYTGDSQWLPNTPVVFNWYELVRGPAGVRWVKHPLAVNENVGSGLQMSAEDVDGDGDRDVVFTSKLGGPWILENKLDPASRTFLRRDRVPQAGRFILASANGRLRLLEGGDAPWTGNLNLLGRWEAPRAGFPLEKP